MLSREKAIERLEQSGIPKLHAEEAVDSILEKLRRNCSADLASLDDNDLLDLLEKAMRPDKQ